MAPSCTIYPLGDAALTLDMGNCISAELNSKVLHLQQCLLRHPFAGYRDSVAAYSSLTVIYDPVCIKKKITPDATVFDWVKTRVEAALSLQEQPAPGPEPASVIRIPVCYEAEYAPDMERLSVRKQLSREAIISLHTGTVYRVYMIGFLPGFAYLATVAEQLATPRKDLPVMVAPGSVGIAGEQTGIYPVPSPGGWHIIGRTPVRLFDAWGIPPAMLKAGDQVQFYPISKEKFLQLQEPS